MSESFHHYHIVLMSPFGLVNLKYSLWTSVCSRCAASHMTKLSFRLAGFITMEQSNLGLPRLCQLTTLFNQRLAEFVSVFLSVNITESCEQSATEESLHHGAEKKNWSDLRGLKK